MIRALCLLTLLVGAALVQPALAQPSPTPSTPAQTPPAQTTPAPTTPAPATPASPSPPDTWVPRTTAEVIMLDKQRAQPATLTIKTGQSATFGSLTVLLKSCASRPPDLPQNAAAFLEITDAKGTVPVFRGWILSNTPSVSQYEHPVYDVRLASCK